MNSFIYLSFYYNVCLISIYKIVFIFFNARWNNIFHDIWFIIIGVKLLLLIEFKIHVHTKIYCKKWILTLQYSRNSVKKCKALLELHGNRNQVIYIHLAVIQGPAKQDWQRISNEQGIDIRSTLLISNKEHKSLMTEAFSVRT